jgi:hypothetical protein
LTPQIEASNTGVRLKELAKQLDELISYAEAKQDRSQTREKTGLSFDERETLRRSGIANPDHVRAAEVQAEDEKVIAEDQAQVAAQPDAG